jgi:hypothetical protein
VGEKQEQYLMKFWSRNNSGGINAEKDEELLEGF